MMGNYHVRFLGEEVMVTLLPYPTLYSAAGFEEILEDPPDSTGQSVFSDLYGYDADASHETDRGQVDLFSSIGG